MNKSLQLESMGVSALSEKQMEETIGGGFSFGNILGLIGAVVSLIGTILSN